MQDAAGCLSGLAPVPASPYVFCRAVQAAPESSAAEAPAEASPKDARDAAMEEAKQLLAQVPPTPCAPVTRCLGSKPCAPNAQPAVAGFAQFAPFCTTLQGCAILL